MQHDKAQVVIIDVLGEVNFEGHFNKCFDNLKETQQKELINWIKSCKAKKENVIQSKKDRKILGLSRTASHRLAECCRVLVHQAVLEHDQKFFNCAM